MKVKYRISILALCLLPGVSSAGILDTALRFWSFDNTLVDSVAGIGATTRSWTSGYAEDRNGNAAGALNLGGDLDAVLVNSATDLLPLANYSISLWFNMNAHNSAGGRSQLFDTRDGSNIERDSLASFIDNTANLNSNDGSNPQDGWLGTFSAQRIPLTEANNQTWHHLLFSTTSTTQSIYYNGQIDPVSFVNYGSGSPLNPAILNTGIVFGDKGNDLGTGFNFNGSLDDIALFDRALDGSDAASLFSAPASASVSAPSTLLLMLSAAGLWRVKRRRVSTPLA
ncbi:LamG-like jellyroll fold domain-containing protein [Congregibacter brevis]|uniref:LamG-like jellyroll fold domain-containing protein n=1 Tax=Congregibacter brevis TaxID=3081201 RepID=A0ABZ0IFA3_9GAMM|nr:LamG-like jellyroll fold domain-containing protein [Congregibacter sp. IMCC45268]